MRSMSPSLTNSGTCTTSPVSSVAGFFAPVAVSPANPGSAPGSYVVNPFGLGAANYSITYLPGTLFVIDPSTTPDAAAGIAVNDTRVAMDRAMAGVATLALCALRSGTTISWLCPLGVSLNFGHLLSPPRADRWW